MSQQLFQHYIRNCGNFEDLDFMDKFKGNFDNIHVVEFQDDIAMGLKKYMLAIDCAEDEIVTKAFILNNRHKWFEQILDNDGEAVNAIDDYKTALLLPYEEMIEIANKVRAIINDKHLIANEE